MTDGLEGLLDGIVGLCRERVPCAERMGGDPDDDEAAWQPPDSPCQLYCAGRTERVAREGLDVRRERPRAGVVEHGPASTGREHRIDEDDIVLGRPEVEKGKAVALVRDGSNGARKERAKTLEHEEPGGVVTAPGVSEADDDGAQGSLPFDVELQEVRRARNARVVVADRLLTAPRQLIVGEREVRLDESLQVVLDDLLVLGGRRDDSRIRDQ